MRKKGFTLIELLVVISIIALLMAILMPALKAAKAAAQGTFCVSNQHSLAMAWFTYSVDHDSKLVGGRGIGDKYTLGEWVNYPTTKSGTSASGWGDAGTFSLEDKKRGIEEGALYPYVKDVKVYHCPADKRFKKPPAALSSGTCGGYRSYSIAGGMNGTFFRSTSLQLIVIYTEIKTPSEKYVFIEDCDDRGWNCGSWIIEPPSSTGAAWPNEWHDPPAIWHYNKGTLGFADGHAIIRRWRDRRTIEYAKSRMPGSTTSSDPHQDNNVDLEFMQDGYPSK